MAKSKKRIVLKMTPAEFKEYGRLLARAALAEVADSLKRGQPVCASAPVSDPTTQRSAPN
jgi:hypothetical protein